MLTTAELTDMRSVQTLTLDQTAIVARRVYADDGAGGQTETSTTANLPCRVAPMQSSNLRVAVLGGQSLEEYRWRVTFAAGADVRKGDRIGVAGHDFEVAAVLGSESRETARVVLCVDRI